MSTFKQIRVALLLAVLCTVALGSWLDRERTTAWQAPLWVVIYPLNGDGSDTTQAYINRLQEVSFQPIEAFMRRESAGYGIDVDQPLNLIKGPQLFELPPARPQAQFGIQAIIWSLKLRYYAWKVTRSEKISPDIQLFVVYYDPDVYPKLEHSIGLQKGLVGVISAFAHSSYNPTNNVIITHELLHTVGAVDKYDSHNYPLYPVGFAEPDRQPLLPQVKAEIMGGRIPITEFDAIIPDRLRDVIVGEQTAREIRWMRD